MLTPYGVGCAYVCMGTWSSLQGVSVIHVSLFLGYAVAICGQDI